MGYGVNHRVKRGGVQIVPVVQSLRSVQVVENGKSGSICSNRFGGEERKKKGQTSFPL
jgi:hypothetical protein